MQGRQSLKSSTEIRFLNFLILNQKGKINLNERRNYFIKHSEEAISVTLVAKQD